MSKCDEFCLGKKTPIDCNIYSDCDKYKCVEACRDCNSPSDPICYCPSTNYDILEVVPGSDENRTLCYLGIFLLTLFSVLGIILYYLRLRHMRNVAAEARSIRRAPSRRRVYIEPKNVVESKLCQRQIELRDSLEKMEQPNEDNKNYLNSNLNDAKTDKSQKQEATVLV